MTRRCFSSAILFVFLIHLAIAQAPSPDLGDTALENLIQLKVSSVARRESSIFQSAGAVFVISKEDIQRSGMTSIPELLRMVPGLDVARIDANSWAVTSRGFNERFADKMLIMIDGRSVLSPLSSGVYWDVQNVLLEDIEKIEVVRGPGATLWGANAVNGVISIQTKKAKDTQGALITATSGSETRGSSAARYGGLFGRSGAYRLFGQDENTSSFKDALGKRAADSSRMMHGGFRVDWDLSRHDALTFLGDVHRGNSGQETNGIIALAPLLTGNFSNQSALMGGNVLGRWQHSSSERFDTTVQLYAMAENREEPGVLSDHRRTLDVELLQHFSAAHSNDLTWGGDYRYDSDSTTGSLNLAFNPANRATNLFGAFLQDEFMLSPNRLWLTVGSKLEHNSYSGFALQPNVRLLWEASPSQSLWAAISKAAENSARFDADIRTNDQAYIGPTGTTTLLATLGTHVLPPESVVAYELGYRSQITERLSIDLATYFNRYSDRHTHEPAAPFYEHDSSLLVLVLPAITASHIHGETHGLELSATRSFTNKWKVTGAYTLFQTHLHATGSQDTATAPDTEGSSPRHEVQLRSMLDLTRKLQFDTAMYYVSSLIGPSIPQYARVDARIGWRISDSWDLSGGGQNLLDDRHFEFGPGDFVNATQIGRNLYLKIVWRR